MLVGRVLIKRSLGEEPRRLVQEGIDLTQTVLDPKMKPSGGRIRLPMPVVTYIAREKVFGRNEPGHYDYTAVPPKHRTMKILVPWVDNYQVVHGRPVLNMPLFRADNVIRIAQRVQDGEAGSVDLQVSVNRYYDEIERSLTGKNGLLTRDVFGLRVKNSLRCVMIPDPDLEPHIIGVPEEAARIAKIEEGDWVIASRPPVLWHGSVLVMRAVIVKGSAGMANPYVADGLCLDFDGDQMSIIKVPTILNPELMAELREAIGDPTYETFKWSDEFLVNNPEPEPNWNQITVDLASRLIETGLSVGPEDCMYPEKSEFFRTVARFTEVPEDLSKYAKGLSIKEWGVEAEAAALEIAKLKLEIGLLGAATDKACQVLLAFSPEHLRTGLCLKERLTDFMMKAAKAGGGAGYDTHVVCEMLDRRGRFKGASVEKALIYLGQIGFDKEELKPVMETIYDLDGASTAVRKHMKLLQACRTRDRASLVSVLEGQWGHSSIAARIHEYTEGAYGNRGLLPYKGISSAGEEVGIM